MPSQGLGEADSPATSRDTRALTSACVWVGEAAQRGTPRSPCQPHQQGLAGPHESLIEGLTAGPTQANADKRGSGGQNAHHARHRACVRRDGGGPRADAVRSSKPGCGNQPCKTLQFSGPDRTPYSTCPGSQTDCRNERKARRPPAFWLFDLVQAVGTGTQAARCG